MSTEGVDYAGSHPTPAELKAAGKTFAGRYAGPGGDWKHATKPEIDALHAAGIATYANAEGAADGLLGGYATGKAWALSADDAWRALGMPATRPIYLACDFDAQSRHWPAIDAALHGAADAIGADRVGVYGSYRVISHVASYRLARWFFQTYAWSAGQWHAQTHLRQYRNHVTLGSGVVDLDKAMTTDYGQWGVSMPATLRPGARVYEYLPITGRYPILQYGDSDAKQGGTRYVRRAQALLGFAPTDQDGVYGPKTQAAVKILMLGPFIRTDPTGRVIGESEWRKLLGAW